MLTSQLENILQEDPVVKKVFGGVHPCNKLPRRRKQHQRLFVANTDPHTRPGSHWVAFYFTPRGRCIYFDSYGMPPVNRQLLNFAKRHDQHWAYNSKKLQDTNSKVCGQYCLMFAYYMTRGKSLQQFVDLFGANSRINDCAVLNFVQRHYRFQAVTSPKRQQHSRKQLLNLRSTM